jgi:maltose O-acetyltransferase
MIRVIRKYIENKIFFYIEEYKRHKIEVIKSKLKRYGENLLIEEYVVINHPGKIEIGSNVVINSFCHFWGDGKIKIGDNVMIASHCAITSITHSKATPLFNQSNVFGEVCIGDNVWIGTHSVIMPGVKIGNNSIIGAGSIVTKDVDGNSVYAGVPAKKIEELKQFTGSL